MAENSDILLEIKDLRVRFRTFEGGAVPAVDGVSLTIRRGQTIGLVGESGSGKTVTAMSVMRLLAEPPAVLEGQIIYHGNGASLDILKLKQNGKQIRQLRGNDIAMIFQEPMRALSPVYSVGHQVAEAVRLHRRAARAEARSITVEMLGKVGLSDPQQRAREYPHELSGGQRQRVMIAMALVCRPQLLIADEPTTALDVTIQAQILELLGELQRDLDLTVWLITHDLGVVAQTCAWAHVMYLGRIVESADVTTLFKRPRHPYTKGLLHCVPIPGQGHRQKLQAIDGAVPEPGDVPPGCAFGTRCEMFVRGRCDAPQDVPVRSFPNGQWSRCYRAEEL